MLHPVIKAYFEKYNLNALLITQLENIRYLSGFTGSTATLLLTWSRPFFFSDFRYMSQAKEEVKKFKIVEVSRDSIASIAQELKKLKLTRIGFEAASLTVAQYTLFKNNLLDIELIPVTEDPAYLRMIKAKEEIFKLKKAIHINKLSFEKIFSRIKPGLTENEVAWMLELAIRECGGGKLSFDIIVASGWRGALPHAKASHKKIKRGELITVDFGNITHGYCSDETTTIGLGRLSSLQKKIYAIVKDAHDFAIEKIRPGLKGKEIDAIARNHIHKKGYGKFFGHGLGHGIGIAVHERPVLNPKSEDIIQENMVFSIEPGIYIPKWGGVRIEDLVQCISRGANVLSEIDKRLRMHE